MKLSIFDASAELGLHPGQFLIFASKLNMPFDDCYPEVDIGLAKTIELTFGLKKKLMAPVSPTITLAPKHDPIRLAERKILEKLNNEHFWGSRSIALETLHVHQCRGLEHFDKAISSLRSRELIIVDRKWVSLNSKKRGVILESLQIK